MQWLKPISLRCFYILWLALFLLFRNERMLVFLQVCNAPQAAVPVASEETGAIFARLRS